jgi:hypothetical protein
MSGSSVRQMLFAIVPLALGCAAAPLSPDGGGALNDDGAAGAMEVASDAKIVTVLGAVPPCGPDTKPSSLLTFDHSLPSFAQALLVDDTGIYIDAGLILRAPLGGGGAAELWAMPVIEVYSFARVDSFLWAAGNWGVPGLLRLPLQGTAPSFAPAIEAIQNVAKASGLVFFTVGSSKEVASYGSDLVAGPTISLSNPGTLIAVAASDVFIVTKTGPTAMRTETRIERGSTNGGASALIATSANDILSIAANSASVYWVEAAVVGAPRMVRRAAHDGSNQEVVANMNVSSLAVDEGAVYFTVEDGTIIETAAATLASTVLAQGQARPSAITQYGTRVYWINDRVVPGPTLPTANAVMTACK